MERCKDLDILHQIRIQFRKLCSKVTGKIPCTYESKHGHDFDYVSNIKYRGETILRYKCSVCGLEAMWDKFTGLTCRPK